MYSTPSKSWTLWPSNFYPCDDQFLWPIKIHLNNNINYHIFSKLIERKKQPAYQACNNMIYFHTNMLFCHMEKIDRFSLLYQDRPQTISFFSRYIATSRCILKLFKKEKEKNDLLIHYFTAKRKFCEVLLHFFFGYHGIKVTTTHFPLSVCQSAAGWQSAIQTCSLLGEW